MTYIEQKYEVTTVNIIKSRRSLREKLTFSIYKYKHKELNGYDL